ncbi:MAG: DotU family type IV/VI secretion system protein, partial [Lysobacteraceae bacterium]
MSAFVERRVAPQPGQKHERPPQRLVDIMYEGFYALFLLKNGCGPQDKVAFADNMTGFLADVDRNAKALGISADDVTAAKYAFCSAV